MKVLVNVDREAAVKAGSEVYGQVIVDLALADLSEEDRAVVAAAPERGDHVTDLTSLPWVYQPAKPKMATPEPLAWIAWRRDAIAARDQWIVDTRVKVQQDLAEYIAWAREQPVTAFIRWDHRPACRWRRRDPSSQPTRTICPSSRGGLIRKPPP